jgi:hypothetical protein
MRRSGSWQMEHWMGSRSQSALAIAASSVGARRLESCLTSQGGPASNTHPPPTSLYGLKPQLSSHPLTVRKLELQSFVTRRSLPNPDFVSNTVCAIRLRFFRQRLLLTCERIDLAITSTPTLHLGADTLERSRNHLIHDEHNPSKSMQSS